MAGSILTDDHCKELNELLANLTRAACETVVSLIGREIVPTPVETAVLGKEALTASLDATYVVAHGDLGKNFADRRMTVMFHVADAIAMSAALMMTPDDVIQERRSKGVIEGEDAEAFGEIATVVFSGIGNVLQDHIEEVDITAGSHGQIMRGEDNGDHLSDDDAVVHTFDLKVGDFPPTKAHVIIDVATAEAWNKSPLPVTGAESGADEAGAKADDDGFEGIPAAPIRGKLAAFVSLPEVFRTLRQSCRRVGLELQRHGKGEIPNPAAHRDQIVLLDIPAGEERQFDWCKRIKDFATDARVVLLLHHPSRTRVTQAFLSKADAILGLPCDEPQLSQKLTAVLKGGQPVAPDGDG